MHNIQCPMPRKTSRKTSRGKSGGKKNKTARLTRKNKKVGGRYYGYRSTLPGGSICQSMRGCYR
jgi:hypothetical protein